MPRKNKTKKDKKQPTVLQIQRRHPRPMGLTNALIQYHQIPSQVEDPTNKGNLITNPLKQERLTSIKHLLINLWTNNNLILNNKVYTFEQMACYLHMPTQVLMLQSNKQMMKVAGLLDENKTKELTRATFFRSLFLGSEIQSQAYSQYLNMLASQGQGYSPFISSEVNKAMSNLIASQKPIHDLLRLTMEKATTNILIQTETSVDKHSNTFVTADEAVRIIKSEGPSMVESEELLLAKRAQLLGLPEGLPNINARTQDLTSIGLKNAPITTNEQSNNLALAGQLGTENEGTSTADRHRKRASDEVEDFEDFMA